VSYADVSRFVTLALDDEALRKRLESDPGGAFQGYDLTDEERDAITSGDERRLTSMGLDPMTAHSWASFHDVEGFARDMPNAPSDVPGT